MRSERSEAEEEGGQEERLLQAGSAVKTPLAEDEPKERRNQGDPGMIFKWDARREPAGAKNSRPAAEGGGAGEWTFVQLAISLHGLTRSLIFRD